jgi:hypothetical protein
VLGDTARPLVTAVLDGADVALALADLDKYSMVGRETRREPPSVVIHRLVQENTRWRMAADLRRKRLEQVLKVVNAVVAAKRSICQRNEYDRSKPLREIAAMPTAG